MEIKLGKYKTRDGRVATVMQTTNHRWEGIVNGNGRSWDSKGNYLPFGQPSALDLVKRTEDDTLPIPTGEELDKRPLNCRHRLSEEGKAHPRTGCQVDRCSGVLGALCEGLKLDATENQELEQLTRRDQFAAMFVQGLITNSKRKDDSRDYIHLHIEIAIKYADALITELNKEK